MSPSWLALAFVALFAFVAADQCPVIEVKVHMERYAPGLSEADVRNHITMGGNASTTLDFVDPSQTYWSCIDGRSTTPLLATPGGDSGEFLAAMSVYDRQLWRREGRRVTKQDVSELLDEWLTLVTHDRRWFLHTDDQTVQSIRTALGDPTFDLQAPVWTANLTQARALEILTQPEYVGCPHLRLVMLHPEQYQISLELSQWYLAAYYDFMWNHEHGPKLNHLTDLEELHGGHQEQAIVTVLTDATKLKKDHPCQGKVPKVAPTNAQNSLFAFHAGSVNVGIRNKVAEFFADKLEIDTDDIIQEVNPLVVDHYALTTTYVGHSLPAFTVTVVLGEVTPDIIDDDDVDGDNLYIILSFLCLIALGVALAVGIGLEVMRWKRSSTEYIG